MAEIRNKNGECFHLTTVRISEFAYNLSKDRKLSRSALLEKAIIETVSNPRGPEK